MLLRNSAERHTYCDSIAAGRLLQNVRPAAWITASSIPYLSIEPASAIRASWFGSTLMR